MPLISTYTNWMLPRSSPRQHEVINFAPLRLRIDHRLARFARKAKGPQPRTRVTSGINDGVSCQMCEFYWSRMVKNLCDLRIPEIKNDQTSKNVKSSDITTGSEACFRTCFDPLDHLGSLGCAQLRPCASSPRASRRFL